MAHQAEAAGGHTAWVSGNCHYNRRKSRFHSSSSNFETNRRGESFSTKFQEEAVDLLNWGRLTLKNN
jgi:hypothetical protein